MTAVVVKDRDALAAGIHSAPDDQGWRPVWRTAEHLADHLLASGAVTTLPDALRTLAGDDGLMEAVADALTDETYAEDATELAAHVVRRLADHLERR